MILSIDRETDVLGFGERPWVAVIPPEALDLISFLSPETFRTASGLS